MTSMNLNNFVLKVAHILIRKLSNTIWEKMIQSLLRIQKDGYGDSVFGNTASKKSDMKISQSTVCKKALEKESDVLQSNKKGTNNIVAVANVLDEPDEELFTGDSLSESSSGEGNVESLSYYPS